jgi:chromatin modification-related protein YNG2
LRGGAAAPLSTKDEQIPQKIDQSYAEVDKLAQEKIQLSERLGILIQRARTRLDYDLRRVLILQGDDPGQPAFVSTSRNPIQEMNDSLRLAIAESSPIVPTPPVVLSTVQAPAQKSTFVLPTFLHITPWALTVAPYIERKVIGIAAASSVKQTSPAPTSTPVLPQRTRLAQQQSHRPPPARGRQIQQEIPGPDEDAEGEDDVEEGNGDEDEDNEDKTLYCFCQKMSYGEVCVTSLRYYHVVLIITNFYIRWLRVITQSVHINGWVHFVLIYPLFLADVRVSSFISHALTSNRHCRRCGTVLTAFRRVPPAVWIV